MESEEDDKGDTKEDALEEDTEGDRAITLINSALCYVIVRLT